MRPLAAGFVTLLSTNASSFVTAAPFTTDSQCSYPISAFNLCLDHTFQKAFNWFFGPKDSTPIVPAAVPGEVAAVDNGPPPGEWAERYGGDIVLRFNISTEYEALKLAEASRTLFLDVWAYADNWVDIRIEKKRVPVLLKKLPESLRDAHVPLMQDLDLAQAIFESYPSISSPQTFTPSLHSSASASRSNTNLFFQDYRPLEVILPWMRLLANMFPTHTRFITVGQTYEGRNITALRVGVHPKNNDIPSGPRKTILVTGGMHAREWISTSTVSYLAWSFVTNYGKHPGMNALIESFDWVFVPTLNPDGYVYTWKADRLWRKNRKPTSSRFCWGIDLDRSYDFHWDGNNDPLHNQCSESFAGDNPWDGTEAAQFADWALNEEANNNATFVAFLDLHSYSQQVLYPYSYTCDFTPPTLEDLEELALGLAKAIRTSHGKMDYKIASACEGNVALAMDGHTRTQLPRITSAGGSALDYFYHKLGVKYAYQLKLRDTGSYGFLLPKENIVPQGKEILDAVIYLGKYLLGEVGMREVKDFTAKDLDRGGRGETKQAERWMGFERRPAQITLGEQRR